MIDIAALPVTPTSVEELKELIGQEIGPSQWHDVTQERIDAFAAATGDHQWIHVDPERAAASGLGSTIAHGLYSLSLGPAFSYALVSFEEIAQNGLNYGYDKVRFPAALPVGSRVRMTHTLIAIDEVPGGLQIRSRQSFEREGGHNKPVAVSESLARIVLKESGK